jgi:hypothetical protein
MLRLNITNNATTQASLHLLSLKSVTTIFASLLVRAVSIRLSFTSLMALLIALSLSFTASVNASTDQKSYRPLVAYGNHLSDTADSHYLIPQMSLIQFSAIFINQSGKPAVELPRRKVSRHTEAYNRSIELLVSTGEFVTPRATINLLNPNASHGYSQDSTEPYRSGGSALGEVLRMGLKSWWHNNEGSQLHAISAGAPEAVRTGKVAGKAKFDWDYSLKFSYDDVKLKFEKAF